MPQVGLSVVESNSACTNALEEVMVESATTHFEDTVKSINEHDIYQEENKYQSRSSSVNTPLASQNNADEGIKSYLLELTNQLVTEVCRRAAVENESRSLTARRQNDGESNMNMIRSSLGA